MSWKSRGDFWGIGTSQCHVLLCFGVWMRRKIIRHTYFCHHIAPLCSRVQTCVCTPANFYDHNILLFFKLKIFLFLLLFKYSYLHFPPPTPTHSTHSYLPPLILHSIGFVHVIFIHVPGGPFPIFPPLSPPSSPLVTIGLLFISMSLVIFYLLFFLLIRFHL